MGGTEGDVDGDEDEGRKQRRRLGKGYWPWIMATKRTWEVLWTHRGGTPNPTGRLGRLPEGGETVLSSKGPGQVGQGTREQGGGTFQGGPLANTETKGPARQCRELRHVQSIGGTGVGGWRGDEYRGRYLEGKEGPGPEEPWVLWGAVSRVCIGQENLRAIVGL